jgi:hypothetical protein
MAHRMWKHTCGCSQFTISGRRECERCGQPGEFNGWGHSVVEWMCRTERRTGYAMGTPLGKWHLPELKRDCPDCCGLGVIDINHGQAYRDCETCRGTGGLPLFSPEVMQRYQRRAHDLWRLKISVSTGRGGGSSRRP